jgi:hypothetical protein
LPTSENLHPSINNQLGVIITNIDTKSEEDATASADETDAETFTTDNKSVYRRRQPEQKRSVIATTGIENHSKWFFTPLFARSAKREFSEAEVRAETTSIGGGRKIAETPTRRSRKRKRVASFFT